MSESEFTERRKVPRFQIALHLVYLNLYSNQFDKAQTNDISVKGLGIVSGQNISLNNPLDIWICVPDNGEKIHTVGEVVWVEKLDFAKYRIGVLLKNSELRAIPLVLRTVQTKL